MSSVRNFYRSLLCCVCWLDDLYGQAFGLNSSGGVLSVSKGPDSTGEWWVEWAMLAGLSLDFTADGDTGIRYRIIENNAPSVRLFETDDVPLPSTLLLLGAGLLGLRRFSR